MAKWDVSILLKYLRNANSNPYGYIQKVSISFYDFGGHKGKLLISHGHYKFLSIRQGFDASPITFRAFPQEPDLCPVMTAKIYLKYRLTISSDTGFFVATTKPHGAASSSTIARWIKESLSEAGIDTGRFTAHSCRASSTSAASLAGIHIITITVSTNE